MQSQFQFLDAARFMHNGRLGDIMPPQELQSALRSVKERPPVANLAVVASVPNWLVEKMTPAEPLATKYVVFPTVDRLDTLLLVTMQSGNSQLRCVLQLSDPKANAFLSDALQVGLFTFYFRIENTRQHGVMGTPMELDEPETLRQLLRRARPSSLGLAPAVQLTSLACHPSFVPNLIEGYNVDDLVTVLAHLPSKRDLKDAGLFHEPVMDVKLH